MPALIPEILLENEFRPFSLKNQFKLRRLQMLFGVVYLAMQQTSGLAVRERITKLMIDVCVYSFFFLGNGFENCGEGRLCKEYSVNQI